MDAIACYADLDDSARNRLFDFTALHDPERFPDPLHMNLAYGSAAFEHGHSQFSLWRGGRVVGAMGAVVREASLRGEVFITAVAIEAGHEDGFSLLLDRARGCMPDLPGLVVRMGISPRHLHVEALAGRHGFEPEYEGLIMARDAAGLVLENPDGWRVETVTTQNAEPYRRVLDEAFRNAPNGATVDAEQIAELMAEISSPDLLAVAWQGDEAVAALELAVQGEVGWIEAIAVAPVVQGRGVGRLMLGEAIARLRAHEVKELKLLVMSTNMPAIKLYERHGFGVEQVTSRWWRQI